MAVGDGRDDDGNAAGSLYLAVVAVAQRGVALTVICSNAYHRTVFTLGIGSIYLLEMGLQIEMFHYYQIGINKYLLWLWYHCRDCRVRPRRAGWLSRA